MISVGTKSLLFGVHQFLLHPISVTLAWRDLYGIWPNWREFICIFIHDWGYWGCPNMDGPEGEEHPKYGARLAYRHLGIYWYYFCITHSRYFAAKLRMEPSKLCWADKLAIKYDPWWTYLPRAVLSGEIHEYRKLAANFGETPLSTSNIEWYKWAQKRMIKKAYARDTRLAYMEGS